MAARKGLLFIGLLVVLYVVFFIVSKRRSATADAFLTVPLLRPGGEIPVEQGATNPFGRPYTTRPIMDVDDYEVDVIYQNEGDRQYNKAEINRLTSDYPFAWAQLPPSAMGFQERQAKWMADKATKIRPDLTQYAEIEGFSVLPNDTQTIEEEEQKLLKTYVPACSKDLKYDVDDAMDLIKKIYEKKGLIAKVDVRPDNVYEVYETMEKNPKIVYEDEVQVQTQRETAAEARETTFQVPQMANDLAAGLDPFFEPGPRLRSDRTDYTQWTPGLERMFAPTYPREHWY